MTHVAFDLALAGVTGFAGPGIVDSFQCPANMKGTLRLRWWATTFQRAIEPHKGRGLVVVVGAPLIIPGNGRQGMIRTLKLHGVCELIAGNLGARYVEVEDSKARKAVLGDRAKKADVLPWARSIGCDLGDDDGDVADAVLFWTWWADRDAVRGRSAPVISDTAAAL